MTTSILAIVDSTGYAHHDPPVSGLKLVWDGTNGWVYATTDEEAHPPSSYKPLWLPGVLLTGSTPVTATLATGFIRLPAFDTTGASTGYAPVYNGSTVAWAAVSSMGGVTGPGPTVTDNALVRMDGTGGLTIQSSTVIVDDNGIATFPDGTQNYNVGALGGFYYFQGRQSSTGAALQVFSRDGDGTDAVSLVIYGVGAPGSIANNERLTLQWSEVSSYYAIASAATGTGTVRPFRLFTGTNTGQLVLNTDGTISTGSTVSIGGSLSVAGKSNYGSPAALTIASGAVTVTTTHHTVAPESGTTDDLDNITGSTGDLVYIRNASSSNTITVRHNAGGTGNLRCNGSADITLNNALDVLMCLRVGTTWVCSLQWFN